MKYLNLGCGTHYSKSNEWTNVDFISTGEGVMAHNLLAGIPFQDNSFDGVYHSHVLEHFSKQDGEKFISECLRVLKKGGVLRIAIPDLEMIAKEYLKCLELGMQNPDDVVVKANYEWMMLEMYDQTVRNQTRGNMGNYLFQNEMINQEFVFSRIGEDGKAIRKLFLANFLGTDSRFTNEERAIGIRQFGPEYEPVAKSFEIGFCQRKAVFEAAQDLIKSGYVPLNFK